MARGFEVVTDAKRKHPDKEIKLPTRGSRYAIAYDIYSPIDAVIKPMEKQLRQNVLQTLVTWEASYK